MQKVWHEQERLLMKGESTSSVAHSAIRQKLRKYGKGVAYTHTLNMVSCMGHTIETQLYMWHRVQERREQSVLHGIHQTSETQLYMWHCIQKN